MATINGVKLKKVQALRVWLKRGDMVRVREMVWKPRSQEGRYTLTYIERVAKGERDNPRIWAALWEVAMENKALMEATENRIEELNKA